LSSIIMPILQIHGPVGIYFFPITSSDITVMLSCYMKIEI